MEVKRKAKKSVRKILVPGSNLVAFMYNNLERAKIQEI
jgi:hypothetical protein